MKKILLLLIGCTAVVACSSNSENTNLLTQKLIGSWKIVGYYDDMEDPITGTNYHPVENGHITNYKADNSFEQTYGTSESGSYSVSRDSILTMNYTTTTSGEPYTAISQILILTDSDLELGSEAGSAVYVKVSGE